jgi:NAD(P)-dependent dehydrogenase (short-subunit alcohol dehydrogenase family)
MSKTILVIGYGTGISHTVAAAFGKKGFAVAIAARSEDKLAAGKKQLEAEGIKVFTQKTDASDPKAIRGLVQKARAELGEIDVIHYNAAGYGAGDLLTATPEELDNGFHTGVTGLVAAIQEALPDLKKSKGAVLVTDGGFGLALDPVDDMCVTYKSMGLGIANAAKHKAVRLLHRALKTEGVYLGEVMVMGSVKGTAWDDGKGSATVELKNIEAAFLKLYEERKEVSIQVS